MKSNFRSSPANVAEYTSHKISKKIITAFKSGRAIGATRRRLASIVFKILLWISGTKATSDLSDILEESVYVVDVGASDGPAELAP